MNFGELLQSNNKFTDEAGKMLKSMQDPKDIDLKTELSHDEVNTLTRVHFLQALTGSQLLQKMLTSFMRLRLSKDRKSRDEILKMYQMMKEIQEKERQINQENNPIR